MRANLKRWWPAFKGLLAVAILYLIGRRFALDLSDLKKDPELWKLSLRPGWMALSGALYVLGLGFCCWYWVRLLHVLGQRPRIASAIRSYYLGLMGKYLPGKAWALVLRAGVAAGPGVHGGIAAMTSFYEVLTTMTVGAMWAAILFALLAPATSPNLDWQALHDVIRLKVPENTVLDRNTLVVIAALLFAAIGLPIVPAVFNRVVHRISLPFRDADAAALPHIGLKVLASGFLLSSINWLCFGASLWAILHAVLEQPPVWSWEALALHTAYIGLAYVAGFVILIIPSGLGVREFFLMLFLVPEISDLTGLSWADSDKLAFFTVVLLRLVWTVAEVVMVAIVYWLPGQGLSGIRSQASRVRGQESAVEQSATKLQNS